MEKSEQYEHLVELVARARVLAAFSGEEVVSNLANKIKTYGVMCANPIGFSEAKFNSDSIKRYKELIGETE